MANNIDICPVCYDPLDGTLPNYTLSCEHIGHYDCFQRMINRAFANEEKEVEHCPLCRHEFSLEPTIMTLKARKITLKVYNQKFGLTVSETDLQPNISLKQFVVKCMSQCGYETYTNAAQLTALIQEKHSVVVKEFEDFGVHLFNDREKVKRLVSAIVDVILPKRI